MLHILLHYDMFSPVVCGVWCEVSEAALKSFHTILVTPPPTIKTRSTSVISKTSPPPGDQGEGGRTPEDHPTLSSPSNLSEYVLWEKAWKVWLMIGMECVCKRLPSPEKFKVFLGRIPQTKDESDNFFSNVPSQSVLIYLVQLFPVIYSRVRSKFTQSDFQEAARVLYTSLIMPVSKDTSPFLVPSYSEHMLNSLQKDVLNQWPPSSPGRMCLITRIQVPRPCLARRRNWWTPRGGWR